VSLLFVLLYRWGIAVFAVWFLRFGFCLVERVARFVIVQSCSLASRSSCQGPRFSVISHVLGRMSFCIFCESLTFSCPSTNGGNTAAIIVVDDDETDDAVAQDNANEGDEDDEVEILEFTNSVANPESTVAAVGEADSGEHEGEADDPDALNDEEVEGDFEQATQNADAGSDENADAEGDGDADAEGDEDADDDPDGDADMGSSERSVLDPAASSISNSAEPTDGADGKDAKQSSTESAPLAAGKPSAARGFGPWTCPLCTMFNVGHVICVVLTALCRRDLPCPVNLAVVA
jgi:hypothetical protein